MKPDILAYVIRIPLTKWKGYCYIRYEADTRKPHLTDYFSNAIWYETPLQARKELKNLKGKFNDFTHIDLTKVEICQILVDCYDEVDLT